MLLPENGDNCSSCELGIEEIDGVRTESDVDAYLENRSVAGEYSDAGRAIGCDFFKTFPNTNHPRRVNGENERPIQK